MKLKNIIILILIFVIIFAISMAGGYLLSNKLLVESEATQQPKFSYQENIDMSYIEKDNISYKGEYVSLNDDKLEFVLNFSFSEDVSNFEGVSLSEYIIEDEKGNLIYDDSDIRDKNSTSYSIENSNIEVDKNIVKQLYRFNLKEKIDSKKIILTFKKVILYNVNKGNPITKELSGDWRLELKL